MTVVQSETHRFADLLSSGLFAVPWHQRYYDWKVQNVEELLLDIQEAEVSDRAAYFVGAVILVQNEGREFEINDGQQRFITFSLICAAFCRRYSYDYPDADKAAKALHLLFDLDATQDGTLDDAPAYPRRVTPPRNDAAAFQQMICGHTVGANGRLDEAWRTIVSFVDALSPSKAERFFNFLTGNIEVACLRIPPDKIDPNEVFEAINSRGRPLADLDRIRNHLYSFFSESDTDFRASMHEDLERIRTVLPRGDVASRYLRCQFQMRVGFLRGDHFYRDIRAALRRHTADQVARLVAEITRPEALELYRAIASGHPSESLTNAFDYAASRTDSTRNLRVLLRELNGYSVTHPIVLSLLCWYIDESDGRRRRGIAHTVARNLDRLAAFVLRTAFVTQRFSPSTYERRFAEYARTIYTAEELVDGEFASFLQKCDAERVLDDRRFIEALVQARPKRGPKVRQLLLGINRELQSDTLKEESCTLEHVLPESPEHWSGWTGFDDVDCRDWVGRLGNLSLLGRTDSRGTKTFNRSFEDKAKVYQRSIVALSRQIGCLSEWTTAAITQRQREMAEAAARAWAFLD